MKNIFIFSVIFSLVIGCTEDGKLKVSESLVYKPKLERSESLVGTDANKNGVRDDIEKHISKKYPNPEQRAAVFQTAKAMQKIMSANTGDLMEIKAINTEISKAFNCVDAKFTDDSKEVNYYTATKEVEAMTTNTKSRLLAYLEFNKALNGTSWILPEGNTCE